MRKRESSDRPPCSDAIIRKSTSYVWKTAQVKNLFVGRKENARGRALQEVAVLPSSPGITQSTELHSHHGAK
jgi:hypothetical protein